MTSARLASLSSKAAAGLACALFGAAAASFWNPPPAPQQGSTSNSLAGCEVDIRSMTGNASETDVFYQEKSFQIDGAMKSGVEFRIVPDSGVAIYAADHLGNHKVLMKDEDDNYVRIWYEPAEDAMYLRIVNAAGTDSGTLDLPHNGSYDPLGELLEPYATDYGTDGAYNLQRIRIWVEYYGMKSAFVLKDGAPSP